MDKGTIDFFNSLDLYFFDDGERCVKIIDLFPSVRDGKISMVIIQGIFKVYLELKGLSYVNRLELSTYYKLDKPLQEYLGRNGDPIRFEEFFHLLSVKHGLSYYELDSQSELDMSNGGCVQLSIIRFFLCYSDIFITCEMDIYKILKKLPRGPYSIFHNGLRPLINPLCASILFDELPKIEEVLLTEDPMYHRCKCYRLALERQDNDIINTISSNIIVRMLLYKEILLKYCCKDAYSLIVSMF